MFCKNKDKKSSNGTVGYSEVSGGLRGIRYWASQDLRQKREGSEWHSVTVEAYAQHRCGLLQRICQEIVGTHVLLFDGQHLAGNISLICCVLRQGQRADKAVLLSVQSCFTLMLPIPTVYVISRLSIPLALLLLAYFYISSYFTLSPSSWCSLLSY